MVTNHQQHNDKCTTRVTRVLFNFIARRARPCLTICAETALPAPHRQTVARVFANSGSAHRQPRQPSPGNLAIPPPIAAPWSCPRCNKHYKRHISRAVAHAARAACRAPPRPPPRPPPSPSPPPPPPGRHRKHNTLLNRLHALLRVEPLVPDRPFLGCPGCRTSHSQCTDCRLIEALKVARSDPVLWDTIVYGEPARSTAANKRRKAKHRSPEGNWTDPRLRLLPFWWLPAADRPLAIGQP